MQGIERLNEAFRTFTLASDGLKDYYHALKDQVRLLNEELKVKNTELKETLGFLNSVIHCIGEAIVVTDVGSSVLVMNKAAEEVLGVALASAKGEALEGLGLQWMLKEGEVEIGTGKGMKTLDISSSAVNDETGRSIGLVLLLRDVTSQREIEAERQRNKRLIAMGEMMATIVHELRNPLCSIELYASMLYRELKETEHAGLAEGVSTGVQNLNNFLTNMLYFARPRTPSSSQCDIGRLVDEALGMIGPVIQSRHIRVARETERLDISGDPGLLVQVLLNLFLNAVQAMTSGGALLVRTGMLHGAAILSIEDTGRGILKEDIERIFDPFYTTREGGTGLGLPISLKIMQSHGGSIRVDSRPGKGSVFTLYFPLSNDGECRECHGSGALSVGAGNVD